MSSLTLIRHGQSTYNVANLFTGNIDAPLTDLGALEAKTAGEKIKNIVFQIAYTSTLIRAQETLRIVLETIGQTNITVIKNAALNERMYGDLQGLNKTETAKKYGDAQVQVWRRSYDVRPPGGESLEDTYNRTVPYYKTFIQPNLLLNENVLIVAHGNSLRALMMYLENISKDEIVKLNLPTGLPRLYHFDKTMKIIAVSYL